MSEQYIDKLKEAIKNEDNQQIISVSTEILNFVLKDDPKIKLVRAIAYINEKMCNDAYKDISNLKGYDFEHALILYKLGRYEEAFGIINSQPQEVLNEERYLHLVAELHYMLNDGKKCLETYEKLPNDSISSDAKVSMSAGCVISKDGERALSYINDESGIDLYYNASLAFMEARRYDDCEKILDKALSKCERGGIHEKLLNLVRNINPASDNLAEFNRSSRLLDCLSEENMSAYIKGLSAINFVYYNQNDHSKHKEIQKYFPSLNNFRNLRTSEIEGCLINELYVAGNSKDQCGINHLLSKAEQIGNINPLIVEIIRRSSASSSKHDSKYSVLFEVQNLVNKNKHLDAAELFAKSEFSNEPRAIATICNFYLLGNEGKKGVEFLNSKSISTQEFLEFATKYCIKVGDEENSIKYATQLSKISSSSKCNALLVLAYIGTDIEMAERYSKRLEVETLTEEEMDNIENRGLTVTSTAIPEVDLTPSLVLSKRKQKMSRMTPAQLEAYKLRHKKRRRLQKPRNYDPDRVPDPDRWKKRARISKRKKNRLPPAKSIGLGGKPLKANKPVQQAPPPPQKKKNNKKKRR